MTFRSFSRMGNTLIYYLLLPIFLNFCVDVLCKNTDNCYLNKKVSFEEEKLLNRISPLVGQTFKANKDGFTYSLAICSDISKLQGNVSVIRSKLKNDTIPLGRRNESSIVGDGTWIMLRYECSKCSNISEGHCFGHRSASIYFVCDPEKIDEPKPKLVEEDECHYRFIISTTHICADEDKVSGGALFLILLSVALFMYFIVGVIYRRLVHNAQGCQQLPHFSFWQRIGAALSDGCNYMCRCDTEHEDSWNNIISNFDSSDRDDALLRP